MRPNRCAYSRTQVPQAGGERWKLCLGTLLCSTLTKDTRQLAGEGRVHMVDGLSIGTFLSPSAYLVFISIHQNNYGLLSFTFGPS